MTVDVDAALETALAALEQAGVSRDRVVLGIVGDDADGGTEYETHVGATTDRDRAAMQSLVVRDLQREVSQQGSALAGPETCPRCRSDRYGVVQRAVSATRISMHLVCMDCGYEESFRTSS